MYRVRIRSVRKTVHTNSIFTHCSQHLVNCDFNLVSRRSIETSCQNHTSISEKHILGNYKSLSIHDMDAYRIDQISRVEDIRSLVDQLESLPFLSADDIGPLVTPLVRITSDEKRFGAEGALLTERIVLSCLSRIPDDIKIRYDHTKCWPFPTVGMWNRSIIAWGSQKSDEAAKRANAMFLLVQDDNNKELAWRRARSLPEDELLSATPNRQTYKSLIRAWAVSNTSKGPPRASEALKQMELFTGVTALIQGEVTDETELSEMELPDRTCYNSVLLSYAKLPVLRQPTALKKIQQIVSRMDRVYEVTKNPEFALDGFSYLALLLAYRRYVLSSDDLEPSYPTNILNVLRRMHLSSSMIEKDIVDLPWAYCVAIDALLKTRRLAEAHELVFVATGRATLSGFPPVTCLDGISHVTLIRVIQAWENSQHDEAAQRIEDIQDVLSSIPFRRPFFLHKAMVDIVESHSSWTGTPPLLEQMLQRALQTSCFCPNGQSFALTMKAWMRSKDVEAPHRVECLFDALNDAYTKTKLDEFRPREAHLRFVLCTWLTRSGDGRRYKGKHGTLFPAEHISSILKRSHDTAWLITPSRMYAIGLEAWYKQHIPYPAAKSYNAVHKASILLRDLQELTGEMPPQVCNWMIQVCSRRQPTSNRRADAVQTAKNVFRDGEKNWYTYVVMSRLLKSRSSPDVLYLKNMFHDCISRALLSQAFVWYLVATGNTELLQSCFRLSEEEALQVTRQAEKSLVHNSGKFHWKGRAPTVLLVENMPPEWSRFAFAAKNTDPDDCS